MIILSLKLNYKIEIFFSLVLLLLLRFIYSLYIILGVDSIKNVILNSF